ncbi:hypothetical protein GCM10012279_45630 [Micromonospora yangpuensis]|nr:hypothetical protein GCM10012279_45630 [Micromonospora yangpuensis]
MHRTASLCRPPDTSRTRRLPPPGDATAAVPGPPASRLVDRVGGCLRRTGGDGILDDVLGQRFYFYYGTGSPAAVGRA